MLVTLAGQWNTIVEGVKRMFGQICVILGQDGTESKTWRKLQLWMTRVNRFAVGSG